MILHLEQDDGPSTSVDHWRARLAAEHEIRRAIGARESVSDDARKILQTNFEIIAIAAESNFVEAAAAALEAAAMAAATVLSTRFTDSITNVSLPVDINLRIPGGAFPLTPFEWLKAVACALIARDRVALPILCAAPSIAAAQRPPAQADEFWPFLCAATAAVIQSPSDAKGWIAQVESLVDPLLTPHDQGSVAAPGFISLQIVPLLPVLRGLCANHDSHSTLDPAFDPAFDQALKQALAAYSTYFEQVDRSANPQRLLSLVLCGFAALAFDRRLLLAGLGAVRGSSSLEQTAPLLPLSLVTGSFQAQECSITLELPSLFPIFRDDPATWLDLMRIRSDSRGHTLVQKGSDLLERYLLPSRGDEPTRQIDFVVTRDGEEPAARKVVLDAGERVLAADLYAQQSTVGSLTRAINQLDRVLAQIHEDAGTLPPDAFSNPAGIAAHEVEPGRFRRDRLQAYRDSLRTQLAVLQGDGDTPPRPQTASEVASYTQAIAAAEVIKTSVEPLLRQLGGPESAKTLAALRPLQTDYERVFEPDAVDLARVIYNGLWSKDLAGGPQMTKPSSSQSGIIIAATPAGMLRGENPLSRQFPGGYQQIAALLKPERVWITWKYVVPGQHSGLAYDGLVWCDDHWAWFPKPHRFLRPRSDSN